MYLTKYQFIKLAGHWQVPAKSYKDSCWNHTINAIKTWLRKHGAASTEIPVYISHVRELLNQVSHDNYAEKLKQFEINWSHAFRQYYMDVIHSEVI